MSRPSLDAASPRPRPRGRPAAASREDVMEAALARYLRGRRIDVLAIARELARIDVLAIARELGLGRTTIYRWFGSREELVGAVVVRAGDPLLDDARRHARGRGGRALLETFDRMNRSLAAAPALRQFLEQERGTALRILTSSAGVVQPHFVRRISAIIEEEAEAGSYEPPVDPPTLAYAIVRLAEAFLYNDAVAGIRGDVDRLREVEAALLGVDA